MIVADADIGGVLIGDGDNDGVITGDTKTLGDTNGDDILVGTSDTIGVTSFVTKRDGDTFTLYLSGRGLTKLELILDDRFKLLRF